MIKLRKINADDSGFLFNSRNNEDVYRHLFNNRKVLIEDHENWIESKLKDDSPVYIILMNDINVGMIQANELSEEVEVGLYVLPEYFGKGIAFKALELFKEILRNNGVKRIVARVLINNNSSHRLFLKSNFNEVERKYVFNL